MREASHPPRPGVRRPIFESNLTTPDKLAEFMARVDTINLCGLAAEITVSGIYFKLFATRRVRVIKGEA